MGVGTDLACVVYARLADRRDQTSEFLCGRAQSHALAGEDFVAVGAGYLPPGYRERGYC